MNTLTISTSIRNKLYKIMRIFLSLKKVEDWKNESRLKLTIIIRY